MSDSPCASAASVILFANGGPPHERWYGIGPFATEKAAMEWNKGQSHPFWPVLVRTLVEPGDLHLCGHCGDLGPVGTDHTCPCPNRDGECPEHG